jgi:hypothetical protein
MVIEGKITVEETEGQERKEGLRGDRGSQRG